MDAPRLSPVWLVALAGWLADGAGDALIVEAPVTVAAPPALAAAILRSTTAGAAGVEGAEGEAPTSKFWLAIGCSRRFTDVFCWTNGGAVLFTPDTGRLATGAGGGPSAVGGVNWGPGWLLTRFA